MALFAVWSRVPDPVGGTRDLFLNHTQFPNPQLFEVRICEQKQNNISYLGKSVAFVLRGRDEQAEAFDKDLVPALRKQAVALQLGLRAIV